ncbi:hypothetical protein GRS96_12290 [Rathayibacter sp. VKM Ac-2803]|nr:hypothetical protein [Rathayibacter sp. VKM Ac-2803]
MPTPPAPAKRRPPIGCLVLVGVVVLAFAGCIKGISEISSESDSGDNQYEAIAQCEARIERLLKAPATAEFDSSATGGGTWKVTGSVDAENSFGATLRSNYACTVVVNGDGRLTTTVDSFDG